MDSSHSHLNTLYIKPSHQLTSGPYQSLRGQLSRQNYFNPQYIQKTAQNSMQQALSQLNKLMTSSQQIERNKLAHIHSIKLHPIINQNFISSFDQNQYKFQPQDKVKIVKEKVFRVQNYYNYLYELKCKQEHENIENKLQKILRQSKDHIEKSSPKHKKNDEKSLQNQKDIPKKSAFNQKQTYLAPSYSKYEEKTQNNSQKYFLKQNQRKKVEQSIKKSF